MAVEVADRVSPLAAGDGPPVDVVSLQIAAPPHRLWELVSDVLNMSRWSPETFKARWIDGATGPAVGARFKGYNRWHAIVWSTTVEVEVADPGREFTFAVIMGGKRRTKWSYTFEPSAAGTLVTETRTPFSTTFFRGNIQRYFMRGHTEGFKEGMLTTLQRLKVAAERDESARESRRGSDSGSRFIN
jgi:uncharacterized protein YndB with AHSA1/START domain